RLAIRQGHQRVAGGEIGVALHPLLLVLIDPAAVGLLPLGQRRGDVCAPVVLLALVVLDLVQAERVEALGHRVVVVVQAPLLAGVGHAGVAVGAVVGADPLERLLDALVVLADAAVDEALDAGVGHAAV